MYEITWLRVMGLIFGNTTFATSTVLAGYMAGLGLGAFLGGKWCNLKLNAVKGYAILEGGVCLYAFLTPALWKLIDLINISFYRTFLPSFPVSLFFKFTVAFLALLIPTSLMGATLPVVSQFLVREEKDTARGVGLLYALNTLGAVLGVLFSAFIALPFFGVWQTVVLTGVLNFFIFYICYFSTEALPPQKTLQPAPEKKFSLLSQNKPSETLSLSKLLSRTLLFCFAVSGAVSMMYEIGWTRVLAMALGSSIYAFSIMLATFLFGISLGSYVFSLFAKRLPIDLGIFSFLQILTGFFALAGMNFLNDMPFYFVQAFTLSRGSPLLLELGKFFLSSLVMLPPTFLIGAMFACFIHVYRRSKPLGHELGEAYFVNTLGTIFGSVLTGFVFIPAFGIQSTLVFAAGLNIGIGVLLFFADKKNLERKRLLLAGGMLCLAAVGSVFIQPWNRAIIASELAIKPFAAVGRSKKDVIQSLSEKELIFYKEGTSATVTVARMRDNLSLAVNGKVDASNEDTFTQFLLGHLPMMLHPNPQKALVIGLGSGSTVAAVASYPVKQIDAIEIEPAVIEATRFFHKLNRNALQDPRVHVIVNDGRNFALLTGERYDVMISEPSNPWMAGVANLFSYEHYKTMGRKLNPGGLVCQWLHAYSMSPEDLQMIIRTFTMAFKETTLWTSYYPDLMLLGSNDAPPFDFERIQQAFEIPQVKDDLSPHGIKKPEGLLASFWLSDPDLRRLAGNARVNSDNHPRLEFSAPWNLYKDTLQENFVLLNAFRTASAPPLTHFDSSPQNRVLQKALIQGYLAKRMYRETEKAIFNARKTSPEDRELLLSDGILQFKNGRLEEAQNRLAQALLANPANAEAHYYLGLSLEPKDPKSTEALKEALRLAPGSTPYLAALADNLMKNEKYKEALPLCESLLQANEDYFDAWAKKTFIILKTGTLEEQLAAEEKFIEKYPRFAGGHEWLGETLEAKGEIGRAFETYKTLAGMLPDAPRIFIKLAMLSDRLGQLGDVKKYTQKAVQLNPALKENPQIQKILSA